MKLRVGMRGLCPTAATKTPIMASLLTALPEPRRRCPARASRPTSFRPVTSGNRRFARRGSRDRVAQRAIQWLHPEIPRPFLLNAVNHGFAIGAESWSSSCK